MASLRLRLKGETAREPEWVAMRGRVDTANASQKGLVRRMGQIDHDSEPVAFLDNLPAKRAQTSLSPARLDETLSAQFVPTA